MRVLWFLYHRAFPIITTMMKRFATKENPHLSPGQRAATYGLLTALALVAGYLELLIPLPVNVPGIKLGLGNAVVLFALVRMGARPAFYAMLAKGESEFHNCTRCRDACPTHALTPEGLDARRCLSYLTIENRGEIPAEAATKMFPYFYGCDRCLRACPHLRTATPTTEEAFAPSPGLQAMTDADWLHLDVEQYRRLFKGSAVKRAKYEGLARNLAAIQTNITTKKEI